MLKIQYQQPDFVLINQENMVNDLMLPCIFNFMMVKKGCIRGQYSLLYFLFNKTLVLIFRPKLSYAISDFHAFQVIESAEMKHWL